MKTQVTIEVLNGRFIGRFIDSFWESEYIVHKVIIYFLHKDTV